MKKALLLLLIFINLNTASGQIFDSKIPSIFFKVMETHGISDGIEYLYSTNRWLKNNTAAKESLKKQLAENFSEQQVGKYIGNRLIKRQILGRTLASVSFMVNYDKQPFRFTFILYRPDRKKEWRFHEFFFDNELIDELIERGKVYMLSEDEF